MTNEQLKHNTTKNLLNHLLNGGTIPAVDTDAVYLMPENRTLSGVDYLECADFAQYQYNHHPRKTEIHPLNPLIWN